MDAAVEVEIAGCAVVRHDVRWFVPGGLVVLGVVKQVAKEMSQSPKLDSEHILDARTLLVSQPFISFGISCYLVSFYNQPLREKISRLLLLVASTHLRHQCIQAPYATILVDEALNSSLPRCYTN